MLLLLSLMTIEPMMFVQGVAMGISQIATDQMLVYKICRGLICRFYKDFIMIQPSEEKYNLSIEFCSNFEDHTDDPIYSDVEKEAINIL